MNVAGLFARLWVVFAQPGGAATPHHRGATWFWHFGLGLLPGAVLSVAWVGLGLATVTVGLVYWLSKERADLARGGGWRDGIEDALAVSLGGWAGYAVPDILWPALAAHAGALLVMLRGLGARA